MGAIIISVLTCTLMILSILFFPKIKIKSISLSTYWIISLIGAILLLLTKQINFQNLINELTSDSSMNPIKILVLFVSMTILSIFLDEVGLFKYIANFAVTKAGNKQLKLFIYLYVLVSILTIFTSNDIIILTFTPFICYFAKNTKINPIPFLVTEFVAANTWSLMFLIGNPTNIYIGSKYNIDFIQYLKVMFIPTIVTGLVSFSMLLLLFNKQLKQPIKEFNYEKVTLNKPLLIIGLMHLCSCIILLVISSYIDLQMWIITLIFAISLLLCTLTYKLITRKENTYIVSTIKRLPFELIPFVLSMFTIVLSLKESGITKNISELLQNDNHYILNTLTSFISCNFLNNIPMSVLFTEILASATPNLNDIYGVIISSNLGAILTPIGALAGIMWMSLLKKYNVKFNFLSFMKYGAIIVIPTFIFSDIALYLVLL